MFALHETTRKLVCRTAFFALCVAPTLATGLWIASHRMPGTLGRTAHSLGDSLDVHVKLANWRHPRPDMIRSIGLTLSDPQSGGLLADVRLLEMKEGGSGTAFRFQEIKLEAAQLPALAEKVQRWLAKLPPHPHELVIERIVIGLPTDDRELVLTSVRGRVDRDAVGRVRLQVKAHRVGPQATEAAIDLWLEPSNESSSAMATLTLDARAVTLPAEALAAIVPGFASFGAECQFQGAVRWMLDRPQPRGIVQGRLEDVDLAGILPAGSPHALRGMATIQLNELSWSESRLDRLAGTVQVERSAVSRSLVKALSDNYRCGGTEGVATPDDPAMVAIDVLAVRFELDKEGLSFWGNFPPEGGLPPGCLAVSGSQPLLFESPLDKWHLGLLVQTLAAPGVTWMPATVEAVEMAERLPLEQK